MDDPQRQHHSGDDGCAGQWQMYGFREHYAASATGVILRRAARRSDGVRTA